MAGRESRAGWFGIACCCCATAPAPPVDPGSPAGPSTPAAEAEEPHEPGAGRSEPDPEAAEPLPSQPAPAADEAAAAEPTPRYPFHEPLPAVRLLKAGPAMRYANLSPAQCRAEVKKRKLPFKRDRRPTPGVATALRFTGPIDGVKYLTAGWKSRYGILDCRLALTLADLAPVLAEHGVTQVIVGTMYRPNSRLPHSGKLSQHGYALAADVVGFALQDGRELNVELDYHGELGAPSCGPDARLTDPTEDAIALRNLVCDIARRGFFHIILTPNYDRPHHDHLHLDIKRGTNRGIIR